MRVCHNLSAGFDDPNLVSCAGLVPVMALAERAGLHDLVAAHVRVPGSAGSNPAVKVAALVAGMVAGADTIDAMDLLRHGGMGRVLTAGRAPLTLGTFLRSFTFGHVRQLDAVASRVLVNLAEQSPLLAGADQVTYLDIDDTIKATVAGQDLQDGRVVLEQGELAGSAVLLDLHGLVGQHHLHLHAGAADGCLHRGGGGGDQWGSPVGDPLRSGVPAGGERGRDAGAEWVTY